MNFLERYRENHCEQIESEIKGLVKKGVRELCAQETVAVVAKETGTSQGALYAYQNGELTPRLEQFLPIYIFAKRQNPEAFQEIENYFGKSNFLRRLEPKEICIDWAGLSMRLRKKREEAGLTKEMVAFDASIGKSTYQKYEISKKRRSRGEEPNTKIKIETAIKLIEALNTSVDYLFFGKNED